MKQCYGCSHLKLWAGDNYGECHCDAARVVRKHHRHVSDRACKHFAITLSHEVLERQGTPIRPNNPEPLAGRSFRRGGRGTLDDAETCGERAQRELDNVFSEEQQKDLENRGYVVRTKSLDTAEEKVEEDIVEDPGGPNKIEEITQERGKRYGHPLDHFPVEGRMYNAWRDARIRALVDGRGVALEENLELCLDHAVRWILDKVARLVHDPLHQDSWDDIAGYVKTFDMARARTYGPSAAQSPQPEPEPASPFAPLLEKVSSSDLSQIPQANADMLVQQLRDIGLPDEAIALAVWEAGMESSQLLACGLPNVST